jgi:hypothetical protein
VVGSVVVVVVVVSQAAGRLTVTERRRGGHRAARAQRTCSCTDRDRRRVRRGQVNRR